MILELTRQFLHAKVIAISGMDGEAICSSIPHRPANPLHKKAQFLSEPSLT